MKKYMLGLMGLALLGGSTLLGQAPQAGPKGEPLPPPVKQNPAPEACCQGGCCPKTKTVCCPEHYIKEKAKTVYSVDRDSKCFGFFHGLGHHCESCDNGHCGHPIHVKYLVKKKEICQHEATKCVPVEVPACGHGQCASGRCCANGNCGGATPATVVTEPSVTQPPLTVVMPTSSK